MRPPWLDQPNTPISAVTIQQTFVVPFPLTMIMWTEFRGPGFGNYTAWRITNGKTHAITHEGCEKSFSRAVSAIARHGHLKLR